MESRIDDKGSSLPQDERKRNDATLAPCGHATTLEGHGLTLSVYLCTQGHTTEVRHDETAP